jgi:hypothetical protein
LCKTGIKKGTLTDEQVIDIRKQYSSGVSAKQLAKEHDITTTSVYNIVYGKNQAYKNVPGALKRLPPKPLAFTDDQVRDIRAMYKAGTSRTKIEEKYPYGSVSKVIYRESYKWVK